MLRFRPQREMEAKYEIEEQPKNSVAGYLSSSVHSPPSLPLFIHGQGIRNKKLIHFTAERLLSMEYPLLHTIPCSHNLTFKFGKDTTNLVQSLLYAHGFSKEKGSENNFSIFWTWSHLNTHDVRLLKKYQKVNHFLRYTEITRKDRLCANIQRMQQSKGFKHFDIIPKTFILPGEWSHFQSVYHKLKGLWIVKPVCLSRGRGISLVNHPDQICLDEPVIVSQYIENPLCINGFKFDLRLYVVVTSYDPLKIYLYEEGLGRFATDPYLNDGSNLNNLCMHLTNYSINKLNPNFVSCRDANLEDYGNKWSMSAVFRHLKKNGYDVEKLLLSIEDVIIKTIISGELTIAAASRSFQPYHGNCFELYGFDILVDENLRPWILEVNLSPSLGCDAPLDLKIKSKLIADLFSLVGVPLIANELTVSKGQRTVSRHVRPSSAPVSVSVSKLGTYSKSEENQVVTLAREEYKRRGGFVRIFPNHNSWELYGAFLENKSRLNYSLHSHLYPQNPKIKWPSPSVVPFSTNMLKKLHKTDGSHTIDKTDDTRGLTPAQRIEVYLRKLELKSQHVVAITHKEEYSEPNITDLHKKSLSKCQLLLLIATYLDKEADTLLQKCSEEECSRQLLEDAEHFEKDLSQFLSNAGQTLSSPITMIIPDQYLPQRIRYRMLVKQLKEFASVFKAEITLFETDEKNDSIMEDRKVDEEFIHTLYKSSTLQLESFLSNYIKKTDKSWLQSLSDYICAQSQTSTTSEKAQSKTNSEQSKISTRDQDEHHELLNTSANQKLIPDNKSKLWKKKYGGISRSRSFTSLFSPLHRTVTRARGFGIEEEELESWSAESKCIGLNYKSLPAKLTPEMKFMTDPYDQTDTTQSNDTDEAISAALRRMTERQNLQDNNKQQSISKHTTEKPNSGSSTNLKSCLEGHKTVFESILHTPSVRDGKLWFYESGDGHMVNSKKPQEPAHVNKKEIVSNFSSKTTTSAACHVSKQKGHMTSGLYKHAHSQAVTQYLVHQKMKSKSIIEKNIPKTSKSKDLRPSTIHSTPTVPISRPYSSNSKYQKPHLTNSSHSQLKQKRSPYEPERYRVQSNSKNRNYI